MKITELLTKETILLNIEGNQKEAAIDQLVDVLLTAGKITNRAAFKTAVLKREELTTTGIGDGGVWLEERQTAVPDSLEGWLPVFSEVILLSS